MAAGKQLAWARLTATVLMLAVSAATSARADVSSDQAGAILVFPKVVVDTSGQAQNSRGPTDTLIRISNTSNQPISLHCFWVNANGHCSNAPSTSCIPFKFASTTNPCGSG